MALNNPVATLITLCRRTNKRVDVVANVIVIKEETVINVQSVSVSHRELDAQKREKDSKRRREIEGGGRTHIS